MLIEFFSPAVMGEVLWADIDQNYGVQQRMGHFERKFQGGVRKLESLGYHVVLFAC